MLKLYTPKGVNSTFVQYSNGAYGAALLSLWCGVAQLVERRLAVRQARVRFLARHHREAFPLSFKAMKRWRETSANGDGQKCCMNVIK